MTEHALPDGSTVQISTDTGPLDAITAEILARALRRLIREREDHESWLEAANDERAKEEKAIRTIDNEIAAVRAILPSNYDSAGNKLATSEPNRMPEDPGVNDRGEPIPVRKDGE